MADAASALRFRLLGSVEAVHNGSTLALGGARQRALLVEAHFSGGDITSIEEGTGVQVTNGENGTATVSVDPKYALRQDCQQDDVVKWDGSSWACGSDKDTLYFAGEGLRLSATAFPGVFSFSLDTAYRLPFAGCNSGDVLT